MSITKSIVEITNSESSNDAFDNNSLYIQTTEWVTTFFDSLNLSLDIDRTKIMYYSFIIIWVLFTSLSINESLKCDNKVLFIILSLLPFVNIILYFSINNLICVKRFNIENTNIQNVENIDNVNREGIGNINSKIVYPSAVFKYNKSQENKSQNLNSNYKTNYKTYNSVNSLKNKSLNNKSLNNKQFNNKPLNNKPLNNKPFNNRYLNTGPLNTGPLNTKPLNNKPLNNKPLNNRYLNTKPLNTKPLNTKPLNNRYLNKTTG